jgi:hypothetical protein
VAAEKMIIQMVKVMDDVHSITVREEEAWRSEVVGIWGGGSLLSTVSVHHVCTRIWAGTSNILSYCLWWAAPPAPIQDYLSWRMNNYWCVIEIEISFILCPNELYLVVVLHSQRSRRPTCVRNRFLKQNGRSRSQHPTAITVCCCGKWWSNWCTWLTWLPFGSEPPL